MTINTNQVSTLLNNLHSNVIYASANGDFETIFNYQSELAEIGKNYANIIENNEPLQNQVINLDNLIAANVQYLLSAAPTPPSSTPTPSPTITPTTNPPKKAEKKETPIEKKPTTPKVITTPQKPLSAPIIPADGTNVNPKDMASLAPKGIPNNNSNCWANAVLQGLTNSPDIAAKILAHKNTPALKNLAKLLQQYYQGQIDGTPVANLNSDLLRASARTLNPEISGSGHEDPYDALVDIYKAVNATPFLTQTYTRKNYDRDGNLVWTEAPTKTVRKDPIFELWVDPKNSYSFEELFAAASEYEDEQRSSFQLKFSETPSEFFVRAKRFTQGGQKIKTPIKLSPYFNLDKNYTEAKQAAKYELIGGMIHLGDSVRSGHFIAIQKRGNKWYRLDDRHIDEISEQVALSELGKGGYILQYRKVVAQLARHAVIQPAMPIVPAQNPNNRTLEWAKWTGSWALWATAKGTWMVAKGLFHVTKFTLTHSASLIGRLFSKKKTA